MNTSRFWAIVTAEMRSCRRLVRTWEFMIIATIAAAFVWFFLHFGHTFTSYVSPAGGLTGPHYAISTMGSTIIQLFTIGIVFLAFDVRSRDIRDRIQEAIETRPMSNFELLTGRLIGIVLLLAIPVVTLISVMWMLGFVMESANFRFGATTEPVSVAAFLVWDIIPNLLLWGSLTIFLSIVVRYRLLVLVIMAGLLLGYYLLSSRIPFFLASALSPYVGTEAYPSALAPKFVSGDIFVNRTCIVLFAGGLLALAAGIHPRQSPERSQFNLLSSGLAAVAIATLGIVGLTQAKLGELRQMDAWASYHSQFQSHSQTDIESISGEVDIFPGRSVSLDLLLRISSHSTEPEGAWLIALNPGYDIKTIEINGSETNDFEFEKGLIKLSRQSEEMSEAEVRLIAKGVPDPMFAYLDSSLRWSEMDFRQARGAFRFGTKSYIFHPQFVALMPGVSWFPSSGAAFGKTDLDRRRQDFFDLDLKVTVPNNWIVAGPGTRELLEQGKRTTYRFNPPSSIPDFALVGAKFERRAMTVEGIEFEMLVSKKHTRNLRTLEVVVPALQDWLGERISLVRETGLEYPYGTLSFVEVPVSMRVYGDGWNLGTVYAHPGIQMIRESGFPIARFDYPIEYQTENFKDDEDGLGKYVLELLKTFFENDFDGGNPTLAVTRNFVGYQTLPEGRGSVAMSFLVEELANKLLQGSERYFSIHAALSGNRLNELVNSTFSAGGGFGTTPTLDTLNWRDQFTNNPSVWELMQESSLSGLDLKRNPIDAYHVLLLKVNSISQLILDFAGEEKIGAFLNELVSKHKGNTYSEDDFRRAGLNVGLDFDAILGDWLHSVSLPGFIVGEPNVERLANTESGQSIYQASFMIRNDESTPGVIAISYTDYSGPGTQRLEPLRIDGLSSMRVAFQTSTPPISANLKPQLSLNRNAFQLNFPEMEDHTESDSPSLPYATKIEWSPYDANTIIVDDLDDGFTSVDSEVTVDSDYLPKWLTLFVGSTDTPLEFDTGLPQLSHAMTNLSSDPFSSARWFREIDPTSHGKYRHTHAITFLQTDLTEAKFEATIPTSGSWRLELHWPAIVDRTYRMSHSPNAGTIISWSRPIYLREYLINVESEEVQTSVDFDAQQAPNGWNDLGVHQLEEGPVRVALATSEGGALVADAVKWTLVEESN